MDAGILILKLPLWRRLSDCSEWADDYFKRWGSFEEGESEEPLEEEDEEEAVAGAEEVDEEDATEDEEVEEVASLEEGSARDDGTEAGPPV